MRKSPCSDALDRVFLGSLRYSAWNLYTPLSSLLMSICRTIVDSSVISERSQICQTIRRLWCSWGVVSLHFELSTPRCSQVTGETCSLCYTSSNKAFMHHKLLKLVYEQPVQTSQSMVKTGFANEKCLKSNTWHVAVPLHCVCSLMNKPHDPFTKLSGGAPQVECECRLPWISVAEEKLFNASLSTTGRCSL